MTQGPCQSNYLPSTSIEVDGGALAVEGVLPLPCMKAQVCYCNHTQMLPSCTRGTTCSTLALSLAMFLKTHKKNKSTAQ